MTHTTLINTTFNFSPTKRYRLIYPCYFGWGTTHDQTAVVEERNYARLYIETKKNEHDSNWVVDNLGIDTPPSPQDSNILILSEGHLPDGPLPTVGRLLGEIKRNLMIRSVLGPYGFYYDGIWGKYPQSRISGILEDLTEMGAEELTTTTMTPIIVRSGDTTGDPYVCDLPDSQYVGWKFTAARRIYQGKVYTTIVREKTLTNEMDTYCEITNIDDTFVLHRDYVMTMVMNNNP